MPINKRISELMPELFELDPPSVDGNDPLVYTGLALRVSEAHMLPGGTRIPSPKVQIPGINLYGAFGGYCVLKEVATSSAKEFYRLLWTPASEFPTWIGSCGFDDPFEAVLRSYAATRFGATNVNNASMSAFVTLKDVVQLLKYGRLATELKTSDVSSTPITIPGDAPMQEAMRTMVSRNVRRLFLEGRGGEFVSDRSLIEFMFAPERLDKAREDPETWVDVKVSALATRLALPIDSVPMAEAARVIGEKPDDCLLTEEGKVVTRWDMVMKPWKAEKLTEVAA